MPLIDNADFRTLNITRIQQLQNRVLRIIFNQHCKKYNVRMGTEEMHKKANLHRLYYRGEQHLLNYAFGLKKDDDNVDKRSIPTRGRRGVCLNTPKGKSNRYY